MTDWVKEVRRSVDYLETRGDIDSHRIAFYGFSVGADVAPIAAALEPRLRTLILMGGGYFPAGPQFDAVNYAPRTRIPVLMILGKDDYGIGEHAQQLLDMFGTPPEYKRLALVEGGHVPSRREDVMREVLDWLDRYLGPV